MDNNFWIPLLQIIWIDIVLSGDNAVVIALACRSLPPRQQKIGVILGAGAAVALRVIFSVFVIYLMATPYLKLVGGVLLLWIGYKLMVGEKAAEDGIAASGNLLGAIRTIVVADAVMSLDNVIAVAAAADGSYVLLILGLLISIPLVVFGATLMLTLVERFPFIVTLGAALIGYIAGEVIVTDVAVEPWVDEHAPWLHIVAPLLGAVLVVDVGKFFAPPRVLAVRDETAPRSKLMAVAVALGGLALIRAPLIVSFILGSLGYVTAEGILRPDGHAGGDGSMSVIGPIIGSVIALLGAELIGWLFLRFRRQRRAVARPGSGPE